MTGKSNNSIWMFSAVFAAVIGILSAGCGKHDGRGHHGHAHGDSGEGHAKSAHIELADLEAAEDPTVFIDNSHDVDGYLAVSWFYKRKDLDRAFSLVDEGLTNNPDAFQLYCLKGQLTMEKARTLSPNLKFPDVETKAIIIEAQKLYRKAAELGLKECAESSQDDWANDKEFDVRDAVRRDVFIEEQHGNLAEMKRLAAKYVEALGEDKILQKRLN